MKGAWLLVEVSLRPAVQLIQHVGVSVNPKRSPASIRRMTSRKMAASSRVRGELLKRLNKVLRDWPVDTERKGRDLGEYLKQSYSDKLKKQIQNDVRIKIN